MPHPQLNGSCVESEWIVAKLASQRRVGDIDSQWKCGHSRTSLSPTDP